MIHTSFCDSWIIKYAWLGRLKIVKNILLLCWLSGKKTKTINSLVAYQFFFAKISQRKYFFDPELFIFCRLKYTDLNLIYHWKRFHHTGAMDLGGLKVGVNVDIRQTDGESCNCKAMSDRKTMASWSYSLQSRVRWPKVSNNINWSPSPQGGPWKLLQF